MKAGDRVRYHKAHGGGVGSDATVTAVHGDGRVDVEEVEPDGSVRHHHGVQVGRSGGHHWVEAAGAPAGGTARGDVPAAAEGPVDVIGTTPNVPAPGDTDPPADPVGTGGVPDIPQSPLTGGGSDDPDDDTDVPA